MLRKITVDKKPDGKKIIIPVEVTSGNIEQQMKIFIEMADYNPFDGQLHIAHFRLYHGKKKTVEVIRRALVELGNPSIELEIRNQRKELIPFFESQLSRHIGLEDKDFGKLGDRSKLPL